MCSLVSLPRLMSIEVISRGSRELMDWARGEKRRFSHSGQGQALAPVSSSITRISFHCFLMPASVALVIWSNTQHKGDSSFPEGTKAWHAPHRASAPASMSALAMCG
ncbi:hypothetical protein PG996_010579 [Apiospora saccharicola]|uniref:Uncharacterized protein n=1 Tax=Apiospora saccharicola TaxID=335842 RepID=A0ABR1US31_9PEZI